MTFDATINLGHILTFLGFALCGLGFIWALKTDVRLMSGQFKDLGERLKGLEQKWDKVADAITAVAVQESRLNAMDRRIDDLQHGRGFILDGLPRTMRSGD